jgi:hypothetical protein
MVEKIQTGDIISLTVHDEPKRSTIQFFPRAGSPQLFVVTELKLTDKNETAYDAMVEAASLGISKGVGLPNNVQVRYDSGDSELDEITIR